MKATHMIFHENTSIFYFLYFNIKHHINLMTLISQWWFEQADLGDQENLHQLFFCLCWGFTAQSTQWGHVERGQFT